MAIEPKTRKMLWGRAASRCAFPDCRIELYYDISETDDAALIGEECHIVARKDGFTRGKSKLTAAQRDKYNNLILPCRNHHKIVDSTDDPYTVEALQELKAEHEQWVRASLATFDPELQRDEELLASYVQEWEARCELDEWEAWASSLLANGHPRLQLKKLEELDELRQWLFTRVWPDRHQPLVDALENFRKVLSDLVVFFRDVGEESGPMWQVEKLHKRLDRWDPEAYQRLADQGEFNVDVVEDLALELTRAANLVCDQVRRTLLPGFRLQEGLVVVTAGPFMDLMYKTYRTRYASGTAPAGAYPGLEQFLVDRETRDIHFGSGTGPG